MTKKKIAAGPNTSRISIQTPLSIFKERSLNVFSLLRLTAVTKALLRAGSPPTELL